MSVSVIPEIRPFSDLRIRQAEILEKLSEGPVVLAQRGRAAAVLVELEVWNRLIQRLEDLEDALEVIEARQNPEPAVSLEEYIARRDEVVPDIS
jgi:PHD/YefM family antitoxin component YafN of YafNO toxin-antitoxin module